MPLRQVLFCSTARSFGQQRSVGQYTSRALGRPGRNRQNGSIFGSIRFRDRRNCACGRRPILNEDIEPTMSQRDIYQLPEKQNPQTPHMGQNRDPTGRGFDPPRGSVVGIAGLCVVRHHRRVPPGDVSRVLQFKAEGRPSRGASGSQLLPWIQASL